MTCCFCHCEECRRATGCKTIAHWYVSQAGDYYELPDDGLPRHEGSAEHERGSTA